MPRVFRNGNYKKQSESGLGLNVKRKQGIAGYNSWRGRKINVNNSSERGLNEQWMSG